MATLLYIQALEWFCATFEPLLTIFILTVKYFIVLFMAFFSFYHFVNFEIILGIRPDGRKLTDRRPISISSGNVKSADGSAIVKQVFISL